MSSPASPSRNRWRRTRRWSYTEERSVCLPIHRSAPRTWPDLHTTPRPQVIAKRCCDSRPRPPRARRRAEPTARRRRSTRGRFDSASSLPLEKRAELLELRSVSATSRDEHDAARVAIEEAIECRRKIGQPVDEARALRWLSKILFCPDSMPSASRQPATRPR